jgi:hypothetical protein
MLSDKKNKKRKAPFAKKRLHSFLSAIESFLSIDYIKYRIWGLTIVLLILTLLGIVGKIVIKDLIIIILLILIYLSLVILLRWLVHRHDK